MKRGVKHMKWLIVIGATAIITTHLVIAHAIQQPGSTRQSTSSQQNDDDTITINAALVNTYVSVLDGSGHFVSGLTKDDFIVLDDGKEQPVVAFSQESSQALRVALVVDRSRSVEKLLGLAHGAARDFLSSVLSPGRDRACLVAFDSGVYVAQDFTDDANALTSAVSRLTAAGGTSMFDAIYKTSRDKLSGPEQARRAIILITDGDDTTSRASLEQATEMALKNNVTIYAIRLPDERSLNVRDLRGKPVLDRLTATTGGSQIQFDGDMGRLSSFFSRLQSELRSQYSIGYQFQPGTSARSFHKISIKVKRPDLRAITRSGYYSGSG
jgi:Ca-activated chloride channel family protein